MPDMINRIVGWFLGLPGRAVDAVSSLAGRLRDFFSGLAGQAYNWGADIIDGVISGIQNNLGGVGAALGGIHLPGMASGGDVSRTGLFEVGEHGKEIVALPGGSHVYPHGTGPSGYSSGMASAPASKTVIENHTHVYLDSQEIAHYAGDNQARMVRLHQARRTV